MLYNIITNIRKYYTYLLVLTNIVMCKLIKGVYMTIEIDRKESRGSFNHGWLKSNHTFSFADYYNPKKMNFGAFRVLNDDYIGAGMGFDTHPHRNMEIISIPIYGELEHKDSMGNHHVLREGEIQMMSAGSGIRHSEYNRSDKEINFLQLWIMPKEQNIHPRYFTARTDDDGDMFKLIISNDLPGALPINQDANIWLGNARKGEALNLKMKSQNHGFYIFIISGEVKIGDEILNERDGAGISDTEGFDIEIVQDSRILAVEVPFEF